MLHVVADSARGYTLWEDQMLAEYLVVAFQDARVINRQRLGPDGATYSDPRLTERERKLLGAAFRRWADAVVIDHDTLYVVEASMLPAPAKIAQLQLYLRLVDVTPELADVVRLPRRGRLVWGVDDQYAHAIAVEAHLEVVIFRPSNWSAWLEAKRADHPRQARPTLTRLQ